ncbi:hypothetical protein QM012_002078 [Aureobasidium pullulans]|uniref:Uncharacterized protein n=1 Tax=Aureobasidium pullulans TaxID=5580 RepID=A0ABR0TEN1_AURPU
MPPYSGAKFQVLLRAHLPDALVEPRMVTACEWESSIAKFLPSYPLHAILGRIRNLDVELFDNHPSLRDELLSLGFTVRPYDSSRCMSIYADTEVKDRTLVQKLQDQLYETLKTDGEDIKYGLVAATPADMMLVLKLDRKILATKQQRYNPQNPCPPFITTAGTEYNTIGYILDNDVFITSPENHVKKFYLPRPPWIIYKLLDKTVAAEYTRYQQEEKEEKVRQHKREKRKAKKMAASAGKGTEQERQGVLEANGNDTRKGGKSYKKFQNMGPTTKAEAGAEDERQRLEKNMKVDLQKLTIDEPKTRSTPENTNNKLAKPTVKEEEAKAKKNNTVCNPAWDMQRKKKSILREIRKPGWFFSGEDALKDG